MAGEHANSTSGMYVLWYRYLKGGTTSVYVSKGHMPLLPPPPPPPPPPCFRRLCTWVTGCVIGNSHLPCPQEAEEGKATCCPQHHYIWTRCHVACIRLRVCGEIRSLSLPSLFCSALHFFTPYKLYSRCCRRGQLPLQRSGDGEPLKDRP